MNEQEKIYIERTELGGAELSVSSSCSECFRHQQRIREWRDIARDLYLALAHVHNTIKQADREAERQFEELRNDEYWQERNKSNG